jgi:uncharacterized Fe-S cluster-containing radical SAM superfamily protein
MMKNILSEERINYFFQQSFRAVKRRLLELRAAVEKKRFYCAALSGESNYNISINSDMTVSCNCQDYSGTGIIGDLRRESLEKVFASPRADHFRQCLVSGRLPVLTCASCSDLRYTTPDEARHYAENWQICTNGIMVENTVTCSYRCGACYRTLVKKTRKSTHMTMEDIRKVAATINTHGIRYMSFFNLGETFASPDIYEQMQIIRGINPKLTISISTNGILLDTVKKRDAALLANHILFSIDGTDDHTMNKYQHGASFSRVYENLKLLAEHRNRTGRTIPEIEWKYVLFNWNDHPVLIRQAIELARNAGIDTISFWPTKSPFYGISWRYYFNAFYKSLGVSTWKGREIHFISPASHPNPGR